MGGTVNLARQRLVPWRVVAHLSAGMYQYTDFDRQFVKQRAAQYRDQLERWLRRRTQRRRVPPAAPAKRLVCAALRADAARGRALRRALQRQLRVLAASPASTTGPTPSCWPRPATQDRIERQCPGTAPEAATATSPRARTCSSTGSRWAQRRRDGPAGQRGHARHPDQRQLHPQHHQRRARRHRGGRDRRPAPVLPKSCASGARCTPSSLSCRASSRSPSPAPREDRAATAWHDVGLQLQRNAAGELGFKVLVGGGMGRTPVIATDDPRVPALEPDPRLPRSRGARLQPLGPARQPVQGAHQDPGQGRGPALHRRGRGRVPDILTTTARRTPFPRPSWTACSASFVPPALPCAAKTADAKVSHILRARPKTTSNSAAGCSRTWHRTRTPTCAP
jgi:sulfite reductase (NADPH) hemoprotein beta-component